MVLAHDDHLPTAHGRGLVRHHLRRPAGDPGIPSLMVHMPGEPLDKWRASCAVDTLRAETLWEAAEKEARKTSSSIGR